MLKLEFQLVSDWPPLSWAAHCTNNGPVITVYHGSRVEVRDAWFCEAIWDGEYDEGDFDLTDLVFGSGCRLPEEKVTFVSSGTTVDRLHSLAFQNRVWISNSLACLLTVADAELDPTYPKYFRDLGSIVNGLGKYKKELEVLGGNVQLTYFDNLEWNGQTLIEVEKRNPVRDFSSFLKYRDFLLSSLQKITSNMAAKGRVIHTRC